MPTGSRVRFSTHSIRAAGDHAVLGSDAEAARARAAVHARRHAVHEHPGLHDHDAARAAAHADPRDRPAPLRAAGVGLHVRRVGERLRRGVLDRPLQPQARAAHDVHRLHRRDGPVRPRAHLRAPVRGAHRGGRVRRRHRGARDDDRRRRDSVFAARVRHHPRFRGLLVRGGAGGADGTVVRVALLVARAVPRARRDEPRRVVPRVESRTVAGRAPARRAAEAGRAAPRRLRRAQSPAGVRAHHHAHDERLPRRAVHCGLQRRQRRHHRGGAALHLFRGRARDALHGAAHRVARRPLRQEARVLDPRVRLARAHPRDDAPAAAAARGRGGGQRRLLRVRARPLRPGHGAHHRQRFAGGARQLPHVQHVGPAGGRGYRVLRRGAARGTRRGRRAHRFDWAGWCAVAATLCAVLVARARRVPDGSRAE